MRMDSAETPAIEIRSLTRRFGGLCAVDDLSLQVRRGEIFGLLGPNGAGKTTTINMVSGLSRPTSGQVHVLGHDVARDPRRVRASLGVVPQETALYDELSAWANLSFHAELYGVPRKERDGRIRDVLDLVQLADRATSRVGTFSGGMKRRLALGRALLHQPELLYLDEPTLGVDVQSRRAIWDYILHQKELGRTVLITTNYLEEANVLCDRVAILDRGKLVAQGTPAELKQRYGDTVIEMVTDSPPPPELLAELRALPGVAEARAQGSALRVTISGETAAAGPVVNLVTRSVRLVAITQREPNLDEVFLSLTGSALRD